MRDNTRTGEKRTVPYVGVRVGEHLTALQQRVLYSSVLVHRTRALLTEFHDTPTFIQYGYGVVVSTPGWWQHWHVDPLSWGGALPVLYLGPWIVQMF